MVLFFLLKMSYGYFGTGNVGLPALRKRKRLLLHGRAAGLEIDRPTRRPPLQTGTGTRAEVARERVRGAMYTVCSICVQQPPRRFAEL